VIACVASRDRDGQLQVCMRPLQPSSRLREAPARKPGAFRSSALIVETRVFRKRVAVRALLALAPATLALAWLRSITDAVLGKTGKPDRVDTATRMAMDADFRYMGEPPTPEREPAQKVDPIDELRRLVGAAEPASERKFADRLRRPHGRR